jgi:hypothetical protein
MRKSIQTFGLASVIIAGLTASPVYAADTQHSSSTMGMGSGMMHNGGKKGMMNMMGQMSQMMETCNNMMQTGISASQRSVPTTVATTAEGMKLLRGR